MWLSNVTNDTPVMHGLSGIEALLYWTLPLECNILAQCTFEPLHQTRGKILMPSYLHQFNCAIVLQGQHRKNQFSLVAHPIESQH